VLLSQAKQLSGFTTISAPQLLLIGLALTGIFFALVYVYASVPR
jgi:mannose/fructose/N-acetylgalactosamine-specific phosphotransferase system component IIC